MNVEECKLYHKNYYQAHKILQREYYRDWLKTHHKSHNKYNRTYYHKKKNMTDTEYTNIARLTMERVGHYNITPLQFYETWKELNPDSTLQKLTILERYIKWKRKIEQLQISLRDISLEELPEKEDPVLEEKPVEVVNEQKTAKELNKMLPEEELLYEGNNPVIKFWLDQLNSDSAKYVRPFTPNKPY